MTPRQQKFTKRDGAMRALHEKGLTLQAIADEFGITRQRVHQVLDKKYNLRRSKLSTHLLKTLDKKKRPR